MKHFYRHITDRYLFRAIISCSMAMGVTLSVLNGNILWIIISSLLLLICLYWQWKLYRRHTKKVLFLLDALRNLGTECLYFPTPNGFGEIEK